MPLHDSYEQFRDQKLTEAEQARLDEAQEALKKLQADAALTFRDGGFYNAAGELTPHPVVQAHMAIAMDRAQAHFQDKDQPAMPEDMEPGIRFPGVDPMGKYSIIDMKFAQRMDTIQCALVSRNDEVQKRGRDYLKKCTSPEDNSPLYSFYTEMQEAAKQHRLLTRASKLCLDPAGREQLHQQARDLETDPRVVKFDKLIQGIEHITGVRQDPIPREISRYFNEELKFLLPEELAEKAKQVDNSRPEIEVNFHNLENKLLLQTMADPQNWGKPWKEVVERSENSLNLASFSSSLPAYAAATTGRIIDPMFRNVERDTRGAANRCDLIAIDGKTVTEIMREQFAASGRGGSFNDFFRQNGIRMTNELVAAGLMAGKRVEAFVPDKHGEVPKEPTQLRKTGYEPSPLKPERFNIWQRFFAKRGFFKEKVARQAEYERVMAARERMRTTARRSARTRLGRLQSAVQRADQCNVGHHKELFFDEVMAEQGLKTVTADGEGRAVTSYNWRGMDDRLRQQTEPKVNEAFRYFAREEAADACVGYLMSQGHKFQDIMDPGKLQKERQEAGRLYYEKARKNDLEWLGGVIYEGHKAIKQQIQELTRGVDLRSENQLMAVIPQANGMLRSAFMTSQQLKQSDCYKGYALGAMRDAGDNPKRANDLAHSLSASVNDASTTVSYLMGGLRTQLDLADPTKTVKSNDAALALGTACMILQTLKDGPTLMERLPSKHELFEYSAAAGSVNSGLRTALEAAVAPDRRVATAWSAASGQLTDELQVTNFQAQISVDPNTKKPLPLRQTPVRYLVRDKDGGFSVNVVRENEPPLRDVSMEFHLGSALSGPSPELQREAPQQEGPKQEAPKKQPLQKTAPKTGGLSL